MSGDSKYENDNPGTTNAIVVHPDGTSPIHRCSFDVLQCIFEKTLPPILPYFRVSRETPWWQAALLCSVCRHWRRVALATPSLWTSIIIQLNKSPEKIESHWIQALQRVKSAPANVLFHRIGERVSSDPFESSISYPGLREKIQERFRRCSLRTIPRIHTLRFQMVAYRYPIDVLSLIEEFPRSEMERLEITGHKPDGNDPEPVETWNTLLHRFPPFRSLKLSCVGPVFFSPSAPLPALVDLCIADASEMKIIPILAACPNLERLSISTWHGEIVLDTSGVDLPCPALQYLRFLEVDTVDDFPWDRLGSFPNLSELKFRAEREEAETPQVVMDFIQRHPSITNISLHLRDPRLPQLSTIAPQLTSIELISLQLNLDGFPDWKKAGMNGPAFPKLQTAGLHSPVLQVCSLDLATFDAFVRKRCLPASHIESELDAGVDPLRRLSVQGAGEWSSSEYIDSATVQQLHPDSHVEKATLSWL